jgi:DNA-binding response OmpR family regulator
MKYDILLVAKEAAGMKDMKNRILLVDDDQNILQLVQLYLSKEGYAVETAARGDKALEMFKANPPSLLLLDVMLPGMDGWQVCREVRKVSNIPVIMLTARDETFDKVLGLELGADDYIVKPFEPKELVARIKAVIRRAQPGEGPSKEISFPGLTVNISRYSVTFAGQELEMPPKELEVLYFLASHANQVFTREQLIEQVWGFDFFGDSRTVDVHVMRLRDKLAGCEGYGWQIKTVWRVGYKFEVK